MENILFYGFLFLIASAMVGMLVRTKQLLKAEAKDILARSPVIAKPQMGPVLIPYRITNVGVTVISHKSSGILQANPIRMAHA